jgi:hypothetical protein
VLSVALGALSMRWTTAWPLSRTVVVDDTPTLALVALEHATGEATLFVRGYLQVGSDNGRVPLFADVVAFDADGRPVARASGHVKPADRGSSSFAVEMPLPTPARRFTVRFKDDEGTIRHVDARNTAPGLPTSPTREGEAP